MLVLHMILLLIGAHYLAGLVLQCDHIAAAEADRCSRSRIRTFSVHVARLAVTAGFALAALGRPWLAGALTVGGLIVNHFTKGPR